MCALMTETSCVPVASSSGAESSRVTAVIVVIPRNSCSETTSVSVREDKKRLPVEEFKIVKNQV